MELVELKWVRFYNRYERVRKNGFRTTGFLPDQLDYLESTYGSLVTPANCVRVLPMIHMDLVMTFDEEGKRRPKKLTVMELLQENLTDLNWIR